MTASSRAIFGLRNELQHSNQKTGAFQTVTFPPNLHCLHTVLHGSRRAPYVHMNKLQISNTERAASKLPVGIS
eukprot:20443-Heterococcus_DN1.PRE.1